MSGPIAEEFGIAILRAPFSNKYAVAPISMLLTAGTMVVVSMIYGWEAAGELRQMDESGWLAESRSQVQALLPQNAEKSSLLPLMLGSLVTIIGIVLTFVVFW